MRHGLRTSVDWKLVGAELAQESDDAQAEFFKSFIRESGTYGTAFQREMQLMSIRNKLNEEEREVLATLSYKGE